MREIVYVGILAGLLVVLSSCNKITETVSPDLIIENEQSLLSTNVTSSISSIKKFKLSVTKSEQAVILSWNDSLGQDELNSGVGFHVYKKVKGDKYFKRIAITKTSIVRFDQGDDSDANYWILKGSDGEQATAYSDIVPPIDEPLNDCGDDLPIIIDPILPDGH